MAVSFVGAGAWANINTTNLTVNFHASTADGDMVVVLWVGKADALSGGVLPTPATPSGWTAGATGASGTVAGDTNIGSTRCISFYKVWNTGDPTSVSISYSDADPQAGRAFTFRQEGSGWLVATTALLDTTTTGTAISATGTRIDVDSGDHVCLLGASRDDDHTWTSPTLATPGVTYESQTWTQNDTSSGSDMTTYHSSFAATAGADSAASTFTASGASGESEISMAMVRVRQDGSDEEPVTGVSSCGVLIC